MRKIRINTKKKKNIPMTIRIAVIAILCIIVTVSAYSAYASHNKLPTTIEENVTICNYIHSGKFNYIAHLKNNSVYETLELYPGQGIIFKKITDHINGSFTYRFDCDQTADIEGHYTVLAKVQTDIWEKEFTVVPETSFSHNGFIASFNTNFPINYTYFEDIVTYINNETGVTAAEPTLIMECNVLLSADITNRNIDESFSPSISVLLGDDIVEIKGKLSQTQSGALEKTESVYYQPDESEQRNIWMSSSLIFCIILIGFAVLTTAKIPSKDITARQLKKIKKKYGEWIVETEKLTPPKDVKVVSVNLLDDLVKLSEELGKPVIHSTPMPNEKHIFYVFDEAMSYQYVLPTGEQLKKITRCPKCQTKITCEGTPGEKTHVICPVCGNNGIATFEKTGGGKLIKSLFPKD